MWEIEDIGKEKYVAAEPLKQNDTITYLKFVFDVFIDVLKVIVLIVPLAVNGLIGMVLPRKPKKITGKLALVTGGGNGLGSLMCERLAKEGCNVAIIDLDITNAENLAKDLSTRYGIKSKAYLCDVSDYEQLEKCREQIKNDLGIVNILINNAGVVPYVSFREKHWTDVDKILKINLNSHLWTTRIFLDDMIKAKDGHIVAISSMVAKVTVPFMVAYATSKYGVNGFMGCLAEEMWIEGHDEYIKTTVICPYFLNTRKEISNLFNLRFPPLDPQKTANRIIDAVLKDEEQVMISHSLWITKWAIYLPTSVKRLASEIVFHVRTARIERPKE